MELIRGVILSDFKKADSVLKAEKQKTDEISNPLNPAGNKDKRTGIERRKFTYSVHLPDKRSGIDRRGKLIKSVKVKSKIIRHSALESRSMKDKNKTKIQ